MSEIPPWLRKRPAAVAAVDRYVKDGMTVGLGTGNAAEMAVDRLAELTAFGYNLEFAATSLQTEAYAKAKGLRICDICSVDRIDITIDGADEIGPGLSLIKGLGGALLKEKIVAEMTDREIIVADGFKAVNVLGRKTPVPVEVCRFAHTATAEALRRLGCEPVLRKKEGVPFVTDEGHYIYDCKFEEIADPAETEAAIDIIPGVVECGIFVDLAHAAELYYEDTDSVREIVRDRTAGPREAP